MQSDSSHTNRSVARRAVSSVPVRVAVVAAVTVHGVATVAVAQAVPPEAADPMAVAAPTAIMVVRTAAGPAGPAVAAVPTVVAVVVVRVRCTLLLAAPVETRRVCHSSHAVTVPSIAATASAVSVTAGPPGNTKAWSLNGVSMSVGLGRRSRTLSPETAVRLR